MDDSEHDDLNRRIERLEKTVEQLSGTVERLGGLVVGAQQTGVESSTAHAHSEATPPVSEIKAKQEEPLAQPPPRPEVRPLQPVSKSIFSDGKPAGQYPRQVAVSKKFVLPEHMRSGEFWLSRVGIGLTLFGVAFLFKYSVEQGWITPWLRIVFGLAIGAVLVYFGWRIYDKKRVFATVLLGGGIGVMYITGFASFQLLELVAHSTAMAFMIVVTLFAFMLSLRQNDAILSIIGALGGFGTPFLLYSSAGSLPGLIMYTCLVIAGCGAVYFFKGWRSLLWLSSICGWLIFLIGLAYSLPGDSVLALFERWSVQGGIIFAWLSFWAMPIGRELAWIKNSDRWARSSLGFADKKLSPHVSDILDRHLHMLSISSPLIGLAFSRLTWPWLSSNQWSAVAFGLCAVYFGAAYYMRTIESFKSLKMTHVLVGIVMFTLGLVLLLDGNTLLFAMATEAVVLHLIARRASDKMMSAIAYILQFFTASWMIYRLGIITVPYSSNSFFDGQTMTDLWVIATWLVTAATIRAQDVRQLFGLFSAGILAGVFLRELEGNAELLALGAEAMVVYLLGWMGDSRPVLIGGHLLFAITGGLLFSRLTDRSYSDWPIFNFRAISDMLTISLAMVVSALTNSQRVRHVYLAVIIAAVGLFVLREFAANAQFVLLALEATCVFLLARILKDRVITAYGHIFFVFLGIALYFRLVMAASELTAMPILNWTAMTHLFVIAVAAGSSKLFSRDKVRTVYKFVAHLAVLGWLMAELSRLTNGQGWVSVSWGMYGVLLLIIGLRNNIPRLRLVGIGTLMFLVAKLFVVDLAELETIWRVLLFIGFGGVFLLLSYYFRAMWKTEPSDETRAESNRLTSEK